MKITPKSDNHIQIETDKGTFDLYSLVGGGLEIFHPEGKALDIKQSRAARLPMSRVVIRVKE